MEFTEARTGVDQERPECFDLLHAIHATTELHGFQGPFERSGPAQKVVEGLDKERKWVFEVEGADDGAVTGGDVDEPTHGIGVHMLGLAPRQELQREPTDLSKRADNLKDVAVGAEGRIHLVDTELSERCAAVR